MIQDFLVIGGIVVGIALLGWALFSPVEERGSAQDLRPKPPPRPGREPKKFSDEWAKVGCPECGAVHKYGLDKDFLECYRCWKEFEPVKGRLYLSYKREQQ